ncbi:MAG: hypothetical protein M3P93_02090, partial [Actinomycetota bacterium]|nr:hypothetical protein [Actinomycetota bacterium]
MSRLLAVLVLALLAGCGPGTATGPAPSWERLPDPPLSPRTLPVVAWTGAEVLVLGGDTAPLCPPSASCVDPPGAAARRRRLR